MNSSFLKFLRCKFKVTCNCVFRLIINNSILLQGVKSIKNLITESQQSDFNRGENVLLCDKCYIMGGVNVSIGAESYLGEACQISAICWPEMGVPFPGQVVIGRGFQATGGLVIIAAKSVNIGDNVLIAKNVFICDYLHGISNGEKPYRFQNFEKIAPIEIGEGSWIGQNVVILPGVKIGRQVVVGANAVVSKDLPDYTMAVGVPAKVIKVYSLKDKKWIST
jgi:acetyltransferase-like isoleucine patch superfamily enzyme